RFTDDRRRRRCAARTSDVSPERPGSAQLLALPSSTENTTFIESLPAAAVRRRALPRVRAISDGIRKCPCLTFPGFRFSKLTRTASPARATRNSYRPTSVFSPWVWVLVVSIHFMGGPLRFRVGSGASDLGARGRRSGRRDQATTAAKARRRAPARPRH